METVMKEKKKDILSLSWPIFVELLLQMLMGHADQIMVGWRDPNGAAPSETPTRLPTCCWCSRWCAPPP